MRKKDVFMNRDLEISGMLNLMRRIPYIAGYGMNLENRRVRGV